MEQATAAEAGEQKGGPPPPPSPLTGCYLLLVVAEPHSQQHKDIILQRIAKGLLSWDANDCLVDLEKELSIVIEQALEGEEARYGERLIQFASENLVTEILIHPVVSTLAQCMRNLLSSFTKHRHIIHAGYTFAANGSWALQDGTFSYTDFAEAFQEHEVQRVLRAYENGITIDLHCSPEGDWMKLPKEPFAKACKVRVNPSDVLTSGSPAINNFVNYISPFLVPTSLECLLESSDVVGNIRFSRPTLYVFPGGQGDAALFGINGFNMLLDGGYARKACFWDFVRHLDRLDAVLMTRLNNSNVGGISSVLRRKKQDALYPQIGHFFCNLQERKALSPDGDKDKDPLLINLLEEGQEIVTNLRHLSLTPQVCYRDSEPINLYHKVGHGTLDMYVLSPAKDSKEVRQFLHKWNQSDQKLFANTKSSREFNFPIQNLVSTAALLVWQPANPEDTITRILFPGSCPQSKVFEGLDRLKSLDFVKTPVCTEKSLSATTKKTAIIDRIPAKEKERLTSEKKENKLIENDVEVKEKIVKKSDSTESDKSIKQKLENGDRIKPKPKPTKPRSDSQQRKKPIDKKTSSPKKVPENGDVKKPSKPSPIGTPAKSAKDAVNRKVIESKVRQAPSKPPAEVRPKVERKPISRRPKPTKAPISPVKKLVNGVQKPERKGRIDKEGTTDSSTVSTPSVEQENVLKKDISKLTPEELQQLKAQELADLKEEQEAVKEIEAVFRKGETAHDDDGNMRKVKDVSVEDKLEKEEYLIIEKEEIQPNSLEVKEDETQKHARDSEESEKQRKASVEERVEIESQVNGIVTDAEDIVRSKESKDEPVEATKVTDREEKGDSADKKVTDEARDVVESQPEEKVSANIKSGDTTTAPTLPEDERIPLDEIKEDNGQVIEEKHVKEDTKEKEVPVIQLPPKPAEVIGKIPSVVGIKLDKQQHIRDIVKTPDEVADLPVHEEADFEYNQETTNEKSKTKEDTKRVESEKDNDELAQEKPKESDLPLMQEQLKHLTDTVIKTELKIDTLGDKTDEDEKKDIKDGTDKDIKQVPEKDEVKEHVSDLKPDTDVKETKSDDAKEEKVEQEEDVEKDTKEAKDEPEHKQDEDKKKEGEKGIEVHATVNEKDQPKTEEKYEPDKTLDQEIEEKKEVVLDKVKEDVDKSDVGDKAEVKTSEKDVPQLPGETKAKDVDKEANVIQDTKITKVEDALKKETDVHEEKEDKVKLAETVIHKPDEKHEPQTERRKSTTDEKQQVVGGDMVERMELGRKSPKEREEDVIKIVASVAEVLKSEAPLEEFEGKLPISTYTPYTSELRETHITTLDSPSKPGGEVQTISSTFIEEEKKQSTEDRRSSLLKQSQELMMATSKMISDIKTKPEEEDSGGTVRRMLVTASSEDGGEETEICPPGSITFSKSSESSGRSSPDHSQKLSQKSSVIDTTSESLATVRQVREQEEKDSGIDDGKSEAEALEQKSITEKDSGRATPTKKTEEVSVKTEASGKSTPDKDASIKSIASGKSTPDMSDLEPSKETDDYRKTEEEDYSMESVEKVDIANSGSKVPLQEELQKANKDRSDEKVMTDKKDSKETKSVEKVQKTVEPTKTEEARKSPANETEIEMKAEDVTKRSSSKADELSKREIHELQENFAAKDVEADNSKDEAVAKDTEIIPKAKEEIKDTTKHRKDSLEGKELKKEIKEVESVIQLTTKDQTKEETVVPRKPSLKTDEVVRKESFEEPVTKDAEIIPKAKEETTKHRKDSLEGEEFKKEIKEVESVAQATTKDQTKVETVVPRKPSLKSDEVLRKESFEEPVTKDAEIIPKAKEEIMDKSKDESTKYRKDSLIAEELKKEIKEVESIVQATTKDSTEAVNQTTEETVVPRKPSLKTDEVVDKKKEESTISTADEMVKKEVQESLVETAAKDTGAVDETKQGTVTPRKPSLKEIQEVRNGFVETAANVDETKEVTVPSKVDEVLKKEIQEVQESFVEAIAKDTEVVERTKEEAAELRKPSLKSDELTKKDIEEVIKDVDVDNKSTALRKPSLKSDEPSKKEIQDVRNGFVETSVKDVEIKEEVTVQKPPVPPKADELLKKEIQEVQESFVEAIAKDTEVVDQTKEEAKDESTALRKPSLKADELLKKEIQEVQDNFVEAIAKDVEAPTKDVDVADKAKGEIDTPRKPSDDVQKLQETSKEEATNDSDVDKPTVPKKPSLKADELTKKEIQEVQQSFIEAMVEDKTNKDISELRKHSLKSDEVSKKEEAPSKDAETGELQEEQIHKKEEDTSKAPTKKEELKEIKEIEAMDVGENKGDKKDVQFEEHAKEEAIKTVMEEIVGERKTSLKTETLHSSDVEKDIKEDTNDVQKESIYTISQDGQIFEDIHRKTSESKENESVHGTAETDLKEGKDMQKSETEEVTPKSISVEPDKSEKESADKTQKSTKDESMKRTLLDTEEFLKKEKEATHEEFKSSVKMDEVPKDTSDAKHLEQPKEISKKETDATAPISDKPRKESKAHEETDEQKEIDSAENLTKDKQQGESEKRTDKDSKIHEVSQAPKEAAKTDSRGVKETDSKDMADKKPSDKEHGSAEEQLRKEIHEIQDDFIESLAEDFVLIDRIKKDDDDTATVEEAKIADEADSKKAFGEKDSTAGETLKQSVTEAVCGKSETTPKQFLDHKSDDIDDEYKTISRSISFEKMDRACDCDANEEQKTDRQTGFEKVDNISAISTTQEEQKEDEKLTIDPAVLKQEEKALKEKASDIEEAYETVTKLAKTIPFEKVDDKMTILKQGEKTLKEKADSIEEVYETVSKLAFEKTHVDPAVIEQDEKMLEQKAGDIEEAYETVSKLAQSIAFEKMDDKTTVDKSSLEHDEKLAEQTAHDIKERYDNVTKLAKTISFDRVESKKDADDTKEGGGASTELNAKEKIIEKHEFESKEEVLPSSASKTTLEVTESKSESKKLSISDVEISFEEQQLTVEEYEKQIPGAATPPTVPVSPNMKEKHTDSEAHREQMDPMCMSFYGSLPDEPTEEVPTHLYEITVAKYCSPMPDLSEPSSSRKDEDLEKVLGKPLGLPPPPYPAGFEEHSSESFMRPGASVMSTSFYGSLPDDDLDQYDPLKKWGKPLGLPSPAPQADNKGTPKKERKIPANVSVKNKLNDDKKRAESPNKLNRNRRNHPIYVDLTYVPHHGNSYYAYVDFFRRIRARYYVFSGIEPSREVYNALLEAKQTWEDKELEVTIIPTYDTDVLGYWVAENEELLAKYKIDLSPSASRCTINLQDHETSCSAYRLEF